MKMPGFVADGSLYRSERLYTSAGRRAEFGINGSAIEAQWIREVLDYGCSAACSAACFPTVAAGYKVYSDCFKGCFAECSA
jgi:hypothetical protein